MRARTARSSVLQCVVEYLRPQPSLVDEPQQVLGRDGRGDFFEGPAMIRAFSLQGLRDEAPEGMRRTIMLHPATARHRPFVSPHSVHTFRDHRAAAAGLVLDAGEE